MAGNDTQSEEGGQSGEESAENGGRKEDNVGTSDSGGAAESDGGSITDEVAKQNAETGTIEHRSAERELKVETQSHQHFKYFIGTLSDLIEQSKTAGSGLIKKVITSASERLVKDLAKHGIAIGEEYNHTIDNSAINHILNRHSSEQEELQGQVPINESDFERVSNIVTNYDEMTVADGKGSQPKRILYLKHFSDGTTFVVEEIRNGRKELATVSMRKYKNSNLTGESLFKEPSSNTPQAIPDLDAVLHGLDTQSSSKKQGKSPKKNEGQFGLVSDERMEELKKRLRNKLNNLNMGVDPEVLAIGLELTAGYIDRGFSYIFIKTFKAADGHRYYYSTSITVRKDGMEIVISNQERNRNRISKLLENEVAWINPKFGLHPTPQIGKSVPLNDSNRSTSTDNRPTWLGINSPETSVTNIEKSSENSSENPNNIEGENKNSRGDVRSENRIGATSTSGVKAEVQNESQEEQTGRYRALSLQCPQWATVCAERNTY